MPSATVTDSIESTSTSTSSVVANVDHSARLSEYDFIVCVDKSGSMGETDCNGKSRWEAMQESVIAFVRDITKLDSDGIGLVVFGNVVQHYDNVGVDQVKAIFEQHSPRGGTPLHAALTSALQLAGKSAKKDFIVVFTDGEPEDKAAAAEVIRNAANSLEKDEDLTILFIQVGRDAGATAYLRQLDDQLTGAKFDIVDAKTITEAEAFASTTDLIVSAIAD